MVGDEEDCEGIDGAPLTLRDRRTGPELIRPTWGPNIRGPPLPPPLIRAARRDGRVRVSARLQMVPMLLAL